MFQGALTTSPGRLKASHHAIGIHYNQTVKTEFSWTEFRFLTTAWVPFIDELKWFAQLGLGVQPLKVATEDAHDSGYGAGWLKLIQPMPISCRHWPTIPCQTHNLPSDIQAVPARATMRAIVELAVLGGCGSLNLDVQGNPVAMGHGSQLSFRDHLSLGPIAVFDQFTLDTQK